MSCRADLSILKTQFDLPCLQWTAVWHPTDITVLTIFSSYAVHALYSSETVGSLLFSTKKNPKVNDSE